MSSGERIIIEQGRDEVGKFFKVITLQENGWLRINTYYACGDTTETYRK